MLVRPLTPISSIHGYVSLTFTECTLEAKIAAPATEDVQRQDAATDFFFLYQVCVP